MNSKIKLATPFFLATLVFFGTLWLVNKSNAFSSPTSPPGSGSGALIRDPSNNNIGIGGAPPADSKLYIKGVSAQNALSIVDPSNNNVLQVTTSGIMVVGNYAANGTSSIQAAGVRASSSYFDSLTTTNASVYFNLVGADRNVSTISNFKSISAQNVSGTIDASYISSGVFKSGNYSFPLRLGVSTTSKTSLPETLSVYGGGYFSGNIGVGMNIPSTASGPGSLNINPSGNEWVNINGGTLLWNKALRVEGNGSAIEFGGGQSVKYGMGANNGKLYFFNTNYEYAPTTTPAYNMVITTSSVIIGDYAATPVGLLNIIPPSGYTMDTLVVGRASASKSSIQAAGGSATNNDLVLNSTGGGRLYLNSLHNGSVFLANGGGNVGIGTSNPSAKLDVAGTVKMTSFQFATTSAASGRVLTAQDSSGNATWQAFNAPPVGSANQTLYYNSSAVLTPTSNLSNNGTVVSVGSGGLTVGSLYVGSTTPANSLIVQSKIGVGTSNPGASLEVVTGGDSRGIRLGTGTGGADLYVVVGTSTASTGNNLCPSAPNVSGGVCLGFWDSSGVNRGCTGSVATGRALCADWGY